MASLLRPGMARRLCGSMIQQTQAAVPEDRRRLGTRFMHTKEHDEDLEEKIKRLKPYQICWELIKIFPARKVFNLVAGTTAVVTLASLSRAVKKAEKKQQ